MNENETLREQMWDLCYGLLTADEVAALHKQIKSDPAAARLYAEARLQADLVASAAKVEDASVTLSVPDEGRKVQPAAKSHSGGGEAPFKSSKHTRAGKHGHPRSYRAANWLAALAASALVALVGYGLYAPTQFQAPAPPDSIVASVYSRQPLQSGLSHRLTVVAKNSHGEPASTDVNYWVRYEGNVLDQNVVHTDQFGEAQLNLPGLAVKSGAVLEVQAQNGKLADGDKETFKSRVLRQEDAAGVSPKLVVPLAANPEPVTSDVQLENDSYQPGDTVRFWVHTWQSFSNQPAAPAKEWKLVAADGREIQSSSIESHPEAGKVSGEFQLPADAAPGFYQLVGVNQAGAAAEIDRVAVGMDGNKPVELARRSGFAGNYRDLHMLEKDAQDGKLDKTSESKDRRLELAKKEEKPLVADTPGPAGGKPPAPAPGVTPLPAAAAPAESAKGAAQPAVKNTAQPAVKNTAPGDAPPAAESGEKKGAKDGLRGSFFKADAKEKGEQGERQQFDQKKSGDNSGVKELAAEFSGDALVVQVPTSLARLNLRAVVTKGNVPVATEQYDGTAWQESQAEQTSKKQLTRNEPTSPEGLRENVLAEKSPSASTQLSLALPPEADGELGVTLYDQTAQPPKALYRQMVRRASARDIHIEAKAAAAQANPQTEVRFTLTATDRSGAAVPNSNFSVRIVKADALTATVVSATEQAAAVSRTAADKLIVQGGMPGRSFAAGSLAAPGATGGARGGGFGGGKGSPVKDGDANEVTKVQNKDVAAKEVLGKKGQLLKAQDELAQEGSASRGSSKPGEIPASPPLATPAKPDSLEKSATSESPQDPAKRFAEVNKGMRDDLPAEIAPFDEPVADSTLAVSQEVLLGSNDSLIRDAARAEEVAAQAAQARFQQMTGRVVLAVAAAVLLLFGLLAILHRPAQAKVWVPTMLVVAGSFGVGCFWLMNGHLARQEIAGRVELPPEAAAPAKIYTEDFKPMAPAAKSLPPPMPLDDSRSGGGMENAEKGLGNANGIGPSVEIPANGPLGRAEKLPAQFGNPGSGGGGVGERPAAPPAPAVASKTEPAAKPSEPAPSGPEPTPAESKLQSERDKKKKLTENRKLNGFEDSAEVKQSGSAGLLQKPAATKSMRGDGEREKRQPKDQAPSLLWQPSLPANEKGEAELNVPLPTEPGDYYLLVDVQGPHGVGTVLIPVHVPPTAPAAPAATPAAPSKP